MNASVKQYSKFHHNSCCIKLSPTRCMNSVIFSTDSMPMNLPLRMPPSTASAESAPDNVSRSGPLLLLRDAGSQEPQAALNAPGGHNSLKINAFPTSKELYKTSL